MHQACPVTDAHCAPPSTHNHTHNVARSLHEANAGVLQLRLAQLPSGPALVT
jgi:hypothetical protein